MPRHILTTALFATSLALAAPALAAPKIAKPADAQTHPQKQPENSNPLQIAQHIQTKDLIGVWANSAETDGGSLLTITMMGTDSKGLDIMLIENLNKACLSCKISHGNLTKKRKSLLSALLIFLLS